MVTLIFWKKKIIELKKYVLMELNPNDDQEQNKKINKILENNFPKIQITRKIPYIWNQRKKRMDR